MDDHFRMLSVWPYTRTLKRSHQQKTLTGSKPRSIDLYKARASFAIWMVFLLTGIIVSWLCDVETRAGGTNKSSDRNNVCVTNDENNMHEGLADAYCSDLFWKMCDKFH